MYNVCNMERSISKFQNLCPIPLIYVNEIIQFNSHIKLWKEPFTPEVVCSYNIMHVKMVVNVKFCIGRGRSKF